MPIYITEIEIGNKKYSGPRIFAHNWEEAERINEREYKDTYEVVGELIKIINNYDN